MKWLRMVGALALVSFRLLAQAESPTGGLQEKRQHDREFWRAIAKNRYAAPEGQPVFPLLRELSGYLGSRDPELRDDLAYTITAVWIKHQKQISADELNSLLEMWRANLRIDAGESGTDGVLRRSFSALCLAALAERDLKDSFLTAERYQSLLTDTLVYLKDERDLRGFDPTLGWIHATAHTADLLGALAGNPLLARKDQRRILDAIAQRLASAHEIFTFGEQDRLALVAARIVERKDFDRSGFAAWLTAMDGADQRVWNDSPPHLALLQTFENDSYMLRGLATYLAMNPSDPAVSEAQNSVLAVLKGR